jgi:hypothetical protein
MIQGELRESPPSPEMTEGNKRGSSYSEAGRGGPDAVASGADDGTLVEVARAYQAVLRCSVNIQSSHTMFVSFLGDSFAQSYLESTYAAARPRCQPMILRDSLRWRYTTCFCPYGGEPGGGVCLGRLIPCQDILGNV